MSEENIIQHCSPTLAGLKSAAMFSAPFFTRSEALKAIAWINSSVQTAGLKSILLRYRNQKALIYIYSPAMLSRELESPAASELLRKMGYCFRSLEEGIEKLRENVESCSSIPHEIGLFLGYPPEDVKGFIDNKAGCYKCSGCWKVYGDEEKAKCLFAEYRKCTESYMEKYRNGAGLQSLLEGR